MLAADARVSPSAAGTPCTQCDRCSLWQAPDDNLVAAEAAAAGQCPHGAFLPSLTLTLSSIFAGSCDEQLDANG